MIVSRPSRLTSPISAQTFDEPMSSAAISLVSAGDGIGAKVRRAFSNPGLAIAFVMSLFYCAETLQGDVGRLELLGRDVITLRDGRQVTEFQDGLLPWDSLWTLEPATATLRQARRGARIGARFAYGGGLPASGTANVASSGMLSEPEMWRAANRSPARASMIHAPEDIACASASGVSAASGARSRDSTLSIPHASRVAAMWWMICGVSRASSFGCTTSR